MKQMLRGFFLFYALCFVVQALGGYFTQTSVGCWYAGLAKSQFTPPGAAFGIAWTMLYVLMAVAAGRVYVRVGWRSNAIACWLIQLMLGLFWTMIFFGQHQVLAGLVVILVNWAMVAATVQQFRRIDRVAAWLMLPLLAWLTFASYLNAVILYQL